MRGAQEAAPLSGGWNKRVDVGLGHARVSFRFVVVGDRAYVDVIERAGPVTVDTFVKRIPVGLSDANDLALVAAEFARVIGGAR